MMDNNNTERRSYIIPASIALFLYVIVQFFWSVSLYKAYVEKENFRTNILMEEVLSKYAFSSYGENLKNPVVGTGLNIATVTNAESDSTKSYSTYEINMESHEQMDNLLNEITILTGIIRDSLILDKIDNILESELSNRNVLSYDLSLFKDEELMEYRSKIIENRIWGYFKQDAQKEYETNGQKYYIKLETISPLPPSLSLVFFLFILGIAVLIVMLFLFVRISRDLKSERKNTHQQELFFYGLVHDLKLPLSLAHSLIDGLASNVDIPQQAQEGLIEADNHILKLTDDINLLLTMHRVKQNKKSESRQIYIYDMVQDIITEIEAHYPEKKVSFLSEIPDSLSILFPAEELKLILRVFIDNAVKYSQEDPKITVCATGNTDAVSIKISDNGSGIKIFGEDKAYELNQSRIRQLCMDSNGGVGLMIAWTILNAKGGKITYERAVPMGSLFTLSIPFDKN